MKKEDSYIADYGLVENSDALGHIVCILSWMLIVVLVVLGILALVNMK